MKSFTAVALALGLALAGGNLPAQAQPERLTVAQMLDLGFQVLASGDALAAVEIADALLLRDPNDPAALFLRAQALENMGRGDGARRMARKAFAVAGDKDTRFSAAMLMAESLNADKRKTAAQLWLRRAGQTAPSADARAMAQRTFGAVRSGNPWIFHFDLSASPSSNVNSGSTETSFANPGIPWLPPEIEILGEQRALSGAEASLGATATYRLPPTATTMTEFDLRAEQRLVWLSSEARDIAPTADASNYSYATVEGGVLRRWRPEGQRATYNFGATLGHNWSGGEDLSNFLRLETAVERPLGPRSAGIASLTYEHQARQDNPLRSADVWGLTFGVSQGLANRDRVQLTLSGRKTDTDSVGLLNTSIAARLSWAKAEPVAGIGLSAALTYETRDYPLSPYDPVDGRQDERVSLDVSLTLTEIDYMGFSPTLDFRASRNASDVRLYSAQDYGVSIGLKSSF